MMAELGCGTCTSTPAVEKVVQFVFFFLLEYSNHKKEHFAAGQGFIFKNVKVNSVIMLKNRIPKHYSLNCCLQNTFNVTNTISFD